MDQMNPLAEGLQPPPAFVECELVGELRAELRAKEVALERASFACATLTGFICLWLLIQASIWILESKPRA